MSKVCRICPIEKNAHSFFQIGENEQEIYYFSYPFKSKYNDVDSIVQHMIAEMHDNTKTWIWVINCASFGLTHLARHKLNVVMIEFISSNVCVNLSRIIIMNQTISFRMLVNYYWRSVPIYVRTKIIFDKHNHFFTLLSLDDSMIELVA